MELVAISISSLVLVPLVIFTSGPLRIVLGLAFVLFFPGYALIAALFPKKGTPGGIERVALSFGLSIAVVPLIGLILNYTPWGVSLYPILISLTLFILAMSGVAWHRRKGLAEDDKFTASIKIRFPSWKGQNNVGRVLSVVLVMAIVGAIGTMVYVIATPKAGEKFTEFYILGPQGKAESYPENIRFGERGEAILGLVNHEQKEMSYQVKVTINGTEDGVKISLGDEDGELTPVATNTINIEGLANGEKWERRLLFQPLQMGEKQKLEFLLLKEGGAEVSLHLWVDVS